MTTTVLFACRQNAGRSQIAAALLAAKDIPGVKVLSAGTTPASEVHAEAAAVLAEIGLEVFNETPALLTDAELEQADWVITMGCGESCPIYPGKHYLDWEVGDPAGLDIDKVREIRDEIAARVEDFAATELSPNARG